MRPRFPSVMARAVAAGLLLAGLTGCSTLHSWVQASSDHPGTAGASMTVPLGK